MVTKNSWNSSIPVEISKGGTNATSMSTSTGIVKYDGTSLVTSTTATIDSSNRMLNSAQPAFSCFLSAQDSDVTGDGTTFTVGSGNAYNEIFDQGSDFSGTTFTAPVTGRYRLSCSIYGRGMLNTHTSAVMTIVTSNRNYTKIYHPYNVANNSAEERLGMCVLADMDAADTATLTYQVSNGTKVVDIGAPSTFFQGELVC